MPGGVCAARSCALSPLVAWWFGGSDSERCTPIPLIYSFQNLWIRHSIHMSYHCHICHKPSTETRGNGTHLRWCRLIHEQDQELEGAQDIDSEGASSPGLEGEMEIDSEGASSPQKRARYNSPSQSPEPDISNNELTTARIGIAEIETPEEPLPPPGSFSFSGWK